MSSSSLKRPNPSDSFDDQPRKFSKTSHKEGSLAQQTSTDHVSRAPNPVETPYARRESSNWARDTGQRPPIPTEKLQITSNGVLPDRGGLFTSPSPISTQTRSSEVEHESGNSTPRSLGNQPRPAPMATMSAPLRHGTSRLTGLLDEFSSRLLATASLQGQRDTAQIQISRNLDEMARTQKFFTSFPSLSEQKNKFNSEAAKVLEKLDSELEAHMEARVSLTQEVALEIESNGKASDTANAQIQKLVSQLGDSKAQIARRDSEIEVLNKEMKRLSEEVTTLKQQDKGYLQEKAKVEQVTKQLSDLQRDYDDVKTEVKHIAWTIDKKKGNDIWIAIDKQKERWQAIERQQEASRDDGRVIEKKVCDLREDYVNLSKDIKEVKSKTTAALTGVDVANLKGKFITQEAALEKLKSDIYGDDGVRPVDGQKSLLSIVLEQSKALSSQMSMVKNLDDGLTNIRDSVNAVSQIVNALETDLNIKLVESLDSASARLKELEKKQRGNSIEVDSLRTKQERRDEMVREATNILRAALDNVSTRLQDMKSEIEPRIAELETQQTTNQSVQTWQIKTNGFSSSQLAMNGQIQRKSSQNNQIRPSQAEADVDVSAFVELGAKVDALVGAFRNLEDRYNNISTDQLYRRIVHALHERYPTAFESLEEIKRLHARLDEFQTRIEAFERECRSTSQLASIALSNANTATGSITKVEKKFEKLEAAYDKDTARLKMINSTQDQVNISQDTGTSQDTGARKQIEELATNLTKLKDEHVHLSEGVTELTTQLDQVKTSRYTTTLQDTGVRKHIEELSRNLTKLKDEHLQLREEVTEFKSKVIGVEAEQTGIRAELRDTRGLFATAVAAPLAKIDGVELRVEALEDNEDRRAAKNSGTVSGT